MRRWNGWGDDAVHAALTPGALELLPRLVGPSAPPIDATFDSVVAAVPGFRLPSDPALDTDPMARVRHARGQSLPDWIAVRSGRIGAVPDAVAHPADRESVRHLFDLARSTGAALVPYGGGTSVVGGIDVASGDRPVITVATDGLAGLTELDLESGLATFGAGTAGPAVETALGAHGLTLGHYPQSFELSTVGGWVATRSAGQESIGYGRIEALYAGGHVETPAGPLDLPPFPASAAGPDLRELVLGSEGRAGIITDVVVRASSRPAATHRAAYVVDGWATALVLARELGQAGLPLTMIRVSTPLETATTFAMAGDGPAITWLQRYLRVRAASPERCLVLVGMQGARGVVRSTAGEVGSIAGRHRTIRIPGVAAAWERERFRVPYLRNALWEAGYAVDTVETAADWSRIGPLADALGPALRHGLDDVGERVHAYSHLSHVYPTGSSLYATYVFRLADDPDETLERWRRLKRTASETIAAHGGTISHQHGIGRDHRPYLAVEKGALGLAAIASALRTLDPDGLMSPGVLLEDAET
jgi:alkyldihydroxyacetonephosphate synthase